MSFNPTSITGLILWLDASDNSTITFSSGSNVSQWNDKSGSGSSTHMKQTTASKQPIFGTMPGNGLKALNFNGNRFLQDVSMNFPNAPYTVFAIGYGSGTVYGRLLNALSDGRFFLGADASGLNYATFVGDGPWNDISANTPNKNCNSLCMMELTNGGSTSGLSALIPYFNGTAQNTKDGLTQPFTGLSVGRGNSDTAQCWNGYVSEVIIYNSVLNDAQRQKVEGYLAWKWGLQTNLPTNHTYYNSPNSPSIITVTTPASLSVALTDKINTYYQIVASSDNTDNSTITYVSSNPYIATVDQTGNVYILSTGTVTITLTKPETNNFLAATPVNCTIYSSIKPSTNNLYTYKGTPINEYLFVDTTYPTDSSFNSAYNTEISNRYFSVIRKTTYNINGSGERVLYIAANDSSYCSLNTGQSITIELWVNLEELPNDDVCLIKKPKEYAVWVTQTSVRCYNYNTNSFTTATTSANLNVGWKHIAFTYTNTNDNTNNASVYINGVLLFSCNLGKSTSALTGDDVFSIGDELGLLGISFSSNLVDRIFGAYGLRIWTNTIRTASEIQSYYNVISPILGVDQYLLKEQAYTNTTNIFNSNTSSSISYLTIKQFVVNGGRVDAITQSVWVNNGDYPLGYINHFKKYDLVNTGSYFKQTDNFKDLNNTKYQAKYVEYTGNDGGVPEGQWLDGPNGNNSAYIIADATDTSYNVTLPTGCSNIRAIVIGGGGGGGAQISNSASTCPGAGASAGAFYVDISNITATSITIKVGNGGSAPYGSTNDSVQTAPNGAASSIIIDNKEWKADKGGGGPKSLSNAITAITAIGGNIYTPNSTSAINTTTNGTISNMNYTCIPYSGNARIQPPFNNNTNSTANSTQPTVSISFPFGNANTENTYPYGIGGNAIGSIGSGGEGGSVNRSSNTQPPAMSQGGGGGFVRVYYMM
jgi:hypothetical protein